VLATPANEKATVVVAFDIRDVADIRLYFQGSKSGG
jgi:hypothetical protein